MIVKFPASMRTAHLAGVDATLPGEDYARPSFYMDDPDPFDLHDMDGLGDALAPIDIFQPVPNPVLIAPMAPPVTTIAPVTFPAAPLVAPVAQPSTLASILQNAALLANTGVATFTGIQNARAIGKSTSPAASGGGGGGGGGAPSKSTSAAPKWVTYVTVGLAASAVGYILFRALRPARASSRR